THHPRLGPPPRRAGPTHPQQTPRRRLLPVGLLRTDEIQRSTSLLRSPPSRRRSSQRRPAPARQQASRPTPPLPRHPPDLQRAPRLGTTFSDLTPTGVGCLARPRRDLLYRPAVAVRVVEEHEPHVVERVGGRCRVVTQDPHIAHRDTPLDELRVRFV